MNDSITTVKQEPDEQVSLDVFESAFRNVFFNKRYKLVHGIVTGQGNLEGVKFVHAWAEFDGMVFDNSDERNIVMPKELYYKTGQIEYTVRYTYDEAVNNVLVTKSYGWWNNEIFDELEIKKPEFKDGVWSLDYGNDNKD